MIRLKDIMSTEVISVGADISIEEAADIFSAHKISGAVVVDDVGQRVGVLSKTDFLKSSRKEAPAFVSDTDEMLADEFEHQELAEFQPAFSVTGVVRDIMTHECIGLPGTAPIMTGVQLMTSQNIHRIFVQENSEVIGVVSSMDVLKALMQLENSETT